MELSIVRKLNALASRRVPLGLAMDFIARFGHYAFVLYGLWLWFAGSEEEKPLRRRAALYALAGVAAASAVSFLIGKSLYRDRPFVRDGRIWNFTGHRANAAFPSNHTMNAAVIVFSLFFWRIPGRFLMALMAGLLAVSRMFAGIHYPTDLLGGAEIAALVHLLLTRCMPFRRAADVLVALSLRLDRMLRALR